MGILQKPPNKKNWKIILFLIVVVLLLPKMSYYYSNFGYDTALTKIFTDHDGKISVTVKQDFVSRPHVFYKGKRIFTFIGSGYMETVHWNVSFLDENTIILSSDPHIGEYFEIKLDDE